MHSYRDVNDDNALRNARDRLVGFPVGRYLQPAPLLFTRDGHNVFLGDMFRGRSAFLLCAGPSLLKHDLSRLSQRGVLTMGVNNAAAVFRPQLWVSVDDPGNFVDAIWRDPGIMKFVPLTHMEKPFTLRDDKGKLIPSTEFVGDMPCVFGFRRNEAFNAAQFLHEDTINWGNHSDRIDSHGFKGSRSVMLVALRLLFYLGVRNVFLLGCDFRMDVGATNYAFEQDRSRASVRGNNRTYQALNKRLDELRPVFEAEGLVVENCTPDSGLTAFPFRSFESACSIAENGIRGPIDTRGMYDRKAREKSGDPNEARPESAISGELSLTTVMQVDSLSVAALRRNMAGWLQHKEVIARAPRLILHSPADGIRRSLAEFASSSQDELVSCIEGGQSPLDWLRVVAEHVRTPWCLSVAPEAVSLPEPKWPLPQWFAADEGARTAQFIGHAWGYGKPAELFDTLNAWGDRIPFLSSFPPVTQIARAGDRIRYPAIAGWLLLVRTAWIRLLASELTDLPPGVTREALLTYVALRRGEFYRRVDFKRFGWAHTYGRRDCTAVSGKDDPTQYLAR